MTNFYICRHGETENNKFQRFSGWIDTPLTAEGVQHAKTAAAKLRDLRLDRIVSSDLGRAFTTAYIISLELGTTLEIERSKALREVNYGDYANQPYSVYPVASPEQNATFTSPHGESLSQMQARVLACIKQLGIECPDQNVLLVGHDGTINAIRATFLQQNIGIADLTHNAHDIVGKFTLEAGLITSFSES